MITTIPKVIRLKDAPSYLGMDKNRFNCIVRPKVTEIPYGTQCIGFDRHELDNWAEDYKQSHGRSKPSHEGQNKQCSYSLLGNSQSRFREAIKACNSRY